MTKIALSRKKKIARNEYPWASCLPFVENSRGTLIHRPRRASTYNIHRSGPHIGVEFWCGMHVSTSKGNLTFLSSPADGKILCERCEAIAVLRGLPTADELAGRHVHKGKTIAVSTCCESDK